MTEIAQILGWLSGALLFAAFAAWMKVPRGAFLQRLGGRPALNSRRAEGASQLLFLAAGVSAVAAVLAVAGWISP